MPDLASLALRPAASTSLSPDAELAAGVLDKAVDQAASHLLSHQRPDGHWVFELEADATIPSEFVMLKRFFGMVEPEREARIGRYLRRLQELEAPNCHGGWPLFHLGPMDISCSVKAYFCLRLIGDAPDAPHMLRARDAILAAGGAEKSNVFTRATLALFGQVPWHAVPVMPPELCLLPRWFPFHLSKVSYWARTVLVPLTVVMARRPLPLARPSRPARPRRPRANKPRAAHRPHPSDSQQEAHSSWEKSPGSWSSSALKRDISRSSCD